MRDAGALESRLVLVNTLFGTKPIVVHAHGPLRHQPAWLPIRDALLSHRAARIGPVDRLMVLTSNNGDGAMGLFEQSAARLAVPCTVSGHGMVPWVNSRDKPRSILNALRDASAEYVLFADSRDAVLLGDPRSAVAHLQGRQGCDLLFGADRINWPAVDRFKRFESALPGARDSQFRYLNGGSWIGRTEFCRQFFAAAADTPGVPEAPDSEQGILKTLFAQFYPRVQLDYRCEVFQNVGFVFDPGVFRVEVVGETTQAPAR